jgi:hypothetical protein
MLYLQKSSENFTSENENSADELNELKKHRKTFLMRKSTLIFLKKTAKERKQSRNSLLIQAIIETIKDYKAENPQIAALLKDYDSEQLQKGLWLNMKRKILRRRKSLLQNAVKKTRECENSF